MTGELFAAPVHRTRVFYCVVNTGAMMKRFDVTDFSQGNFALPELKPGMCVVLYTDKGPGGPCGQSVDITCPHASVLIFPNYETMQQYTDGRPFRLGTKADIRWFEVGSHGTGRLSINVHPDCSP